MPVTHRRILMPSEAERSDFDDLDNDYAIEPGRDLVMNPTDRSASMRGNVITVSLASVSQQTSTPGVSVQTQADEQPWTVTIQTLTQAGGEGAVANYITAYVLYGQGDAIFTRTIQIPATGIPVKFTIVARYANVSFWYSAGAPTSPALVSVGIVPGQYLGPDAYAWAWTNNPLTGAVSGGRVWTGAGVIGQVHVMMTAAAAPGGVPLWPLLFDTTVFPPAGGTSPIFGGQLGAMFAAGDDRSYGDEEAPGALYFNTGLVVALSTSPDTYAAPAAGNNISAAVKVGQ